METIAVAPHPYLDNIITGNDGFLYSLAPGLRNQEYGLDGHRDQEGESQAD